MMPDSQGRNAPWYFDVGLVLVCSAIAIGIACIPIDAIRFEGGYVPQYPDSFYHATRILSTYRNPDNFVQWDVDSFYPGGAFNSWPWLYDWSLASVLRIVSPAHPVAFLDFIPPAWILVNCLLLLVICRELGMAWQARLIALGCFAVSPLTQLLHMVGRIDHHYMEYTMVLATIAGTLSWANRPHSTRHALIAGYVPGLAVGINPGLFALQVPLLVSLFIGWLRGDPKPERASLYAGGMMVAVTLLLTVYSQPAQAGMFAFDLLSWFHVYVAACSAVAIWLMSRLPHRVMSVFFLVGLAIALAVPLLGSSSEGIAFLNARGPLLNITETHSFFEAPSLFFRSHTPLLLLVPFTLAGCAVASLRSHSPRTLVLACFSIFGLTLLLTQHRLNYFGSFALYVTPLFYLQHLLKNAGPQPQQAGWATALIVAILANAGVPYELRATGHAADSLPARAIAALKPICGEQPTTVLAPIGIAHQLRFMTGCRVMANPMQGIDLIQTVKAGHVQQLLSLDPNALRETPDDFTYVLAEGLAANYAPRSTGLVYPGLIQYFDRALVPAGYTRLSLEAYSNKTPVTAGGRSLLDALVAAYEPRKYAYLHEEYALLKVDKVPALQALPSPERDRP